MDWLDDDGLLDTLIHKFRFAAYLAHSVRKSILDLVIIQRTTWYFILSIFILKAILIRWWRVYNTGFDVFFIVVATISVFLMILAVRSITKRTEASGKAVHSKQHLTHQLRAKTEALPNTQKAAQKQSLHESVSTERIFFCALQVVLFWLCFAFARKLANRSAWETSPSWTAGYIAVLILLLGVLVLTLPRQVPLFSAVMALPPYVDKDNLKTFLFVMEATAQREAHQQARQERKTTCAKSAELRMRSSTHSEDQPQEQPQEQPPQSGPQVAWSEA